MEQPKQDTKEIPIFRDKSVREEAYRHKILQLEGEIAQLETIAKEAHQSKQKIDSSTAHLENYYRERLLSFDKNLKKEEDFLERRAAEVTDRLDIQAQRIILDMETSFRRKTRWFIFSLFALQAFFLIILIYVYTNKDINIPFMYSTKYTEYPATPEKLQSRLSYILTAIQTQTRYHNLYEVREMDVIDGSYIAEIELRFKPTDRWFLKSLSTNLIKTFQRYSNYAPAEVGFFYKGRLYCKAYLEGIPQKVRFQYFY